MSSKSLGRTAATSRSGAAPSWDELLRGSRPLRSSYAVPPLGRVALVKEGAPPEALRLLSERMGITRERLYATIGVPRATMERKLRQRRRLDQDESERVLGLARLVGQVEEMVRESGEARDFDAARWLAGWLERPLPALGGRRPGELMDTAPGREIVSGLVAQMQSGAYA